jgi:hypothetical protein
MVAVPLPLEHQLPQLVWWAHYAALELSCSVVLINGTVLFFVLDLLVSD